VVETVFLTPNEEFIYLSSRVIKEVWTLGGDVSGLVPEPVRLSLEALRARQGTRV
jgi:pantetheine-phosphate adenylyltransferase